MKNNLEIRQALEADASDIAELIYSTSVACCFTSEQPCPEWYRESVQTSQIANLLKSEQMVWLVAAQEQTLAGVLAVSDKSHVKYFFVHPAYQKLGIGKQSSSNIITFSSCCNTQDIPDATRYLQPILYCA